MARAFIIAFALGLAWGCSVSSGFSCKGNDECVLSGTPGVCTVDKACAYPSAECTSGFAYPEGAPSGLAGHCADVDTVGSTGSTSTADGGDDSETGVVTTGADSTSDDDTTAASSESEGGEASTSGGGSSETGSCDNLLATAVTSADTFFETGCSATCQSFNFGATAANTLRWDASAHTVMAVDFDTAELVTLPLADVQTIRLVLNGIGGGESVSLTVSSILPMYEWAEGTHSGVTASKGESSWACWSCPGNAWPSGGPPAGTGSDVGMTVVPSDFSGEIQIELDKATLYDDYVTGANGLLIYVPTMEAGTVQVFSRESDTPPELRFYGC